MSKLIFIFFILLVLNIVGCAQETDPRQFKSADPAFSSQLSLFEKLYGQPVHDAAMGFSDLPYPQVGVCRKFSTGHWEIHIDSEYWQYSSEEAKIGLILHELAHCVLNRDHDTATFWHQGKHVSGQVPKSLMYPYNFYSRYYEDLESYYLRELFNPSAPVYLKMGEKLYYDIN